MNIESLILDEIKKQGDVRVAEVVEVTGFSRAYVHRFLQKMQSEGKISLVGRANQAHYVLNTSQDIIQAKKGLTKVDLPLKNTDLNEDVIEDKIREETGIFFDLPKNVKGIVDFAFLEMLNNAIEHSRSKSIRVTMSRFNNELIFDIFDSGIGVFVSIRKKKDLKNDLEAIQDLLKGKETTDPERHTGQGIFFTARIADKFIIYSSKKKLIFDNEIGDVFLKDSPVRKGTRVHFEIALNSKKKAEDVFKKYTEKGSYEFSKTEVIIRLYKMDVGYISRSQARRVTAGLEEFKSVLLDFDKVDTVGQGFADEVFRVWQKRNPDTKLTYKNANENVLFMIERAISDFQAR